MERTVVNNIAVQLAYLPGVDRTTYQNPQPLSTPGEYHELFQAVFGPEFPVGDTYDVVINDLFGGAPGASPGLFDEVMGLTFSPFGVETGVYTHGRTVFTALLSQINSETLSDAQITALDTSTDYINGLQSNIDSLLELDNRDTTLLDVVNMSHGLGVNIEALATILEIEDLTTANINDYQAVIFEKLLDLPLDAWKSLYRSPTGKPIEDIDYATIPSILRDLDYLVNYDGNNQLLDKPDTIVVVATPNASEGAINLLSLVPNVVTASGLTHDGELHSFAAPSSLSDAFAPFELVPSTLSDEQGNVTHFKLGNYTAPIEQTTAGQFNGQSVQDVLASEADYELLNHFINRQLDSSDPTAYEDAINKLSESVFSVEELFDRHILGLLQIRACFQSFQEGAGSRKKERSDGSLPVVRD